MPKPYELIQSTVASGGAVGSLSLTSIPSGYVSLLLVMSLRSARSNSIDDGLNLKFNGEGTTGNINSTLLYGYGTTYGVGYSPESGYMNGNLGTADIFSTAEIFIPNYTSSDTIKPYLSFTMCENNGTQSLCDVRAMRWSSGGAAITSINISAATGNNLMQYSAAYLYGLTNS